ncbi:MAG: Uma2 family endonuclease [Bacteroidota bacterium]
MPVKLKKRLLTVEEYHRMGEVGILKEKGLELIRGEILKMSPIGSKHAAVVEKLKETLTFSLKGKTLVRAQNPITLGEMSEPEPDIAIVNFRSDYYMHQHPQAKDTLLVIEVAASSLDYDREIKVPLYAAASIPEFWIIDLNSEQVEVFHSPSQSSYLHTEIYESDGILRSQDGLIDLSLKEIFI